MKEFRDIPTLKPFFKKNYCEELPAITMSVEENSVRLTVIALEDWNLRNKRKQVRKKRKKKRKKEN